MRFLEELVYKAARAPGSGAYPGPVYDDETMALETNEPIIIEDDEPELGSKEKPIVIEDDK